MAIVLPEDHTALLFALKGRVEINHATTLNAAELAFFERKGATITLPARQDLMLLLMNGKPIDEPIHPPNINHDLPNKIRHCQRLMKSSYLKCMPADSAFKV